MYAVGDIIARKGKRLGVITDLLPRGGFVIRYDDPVAEGLRPPCNCDVLGAARVTGLEVIGRDQERFKRESARLVQVVAAQNRELHREWAQAPEVVEATAAGVSADVLKQLSLFG